MRLSGIFAADVQVFRFFPDCTVLDVLVKPAPGSEVGETIAGWLRKDAPIAGVHVSRYVIQRHNVSFTSRSHWGDWPVEVQGSWSGRSLTLNVRDGPRVKKGLEFQRIWPS